MNKSMVKCPSCATEIELTEALTGQIEADVRAQMQIKAKAAIEANRQQVIAEAAQKSKVLEGQIAEQQKKIALANENELSFRKAQQALKDKTASLELTVQQRLDTERVKIVDQQRKQFELEGQAAKKAMTDEIEQKNLLIAKANEKELTFLKEKRLLEEKAQKMDLEIERKMTEERKKITLDATEKAAESSLLKMREKEDQIKAMHDQIESLKRKSELGSQEAQGEALEDELKELLEREFPFDTIEEVKKGARGADVVQIIHNSSGKACGKILWESKNTKEFQKLWIDKLKKDQQDAGADVAVILSMALPNAVKSFGHHEGIWVTNFKSTVGLATALRHGLIEAHRQKAITIGRDSIKDVIYNYVTSQEFTFHVKSVLGAYDQMKEDLDTEKKAMGRIWKKREKQITTVVENLTGMYGSIEGIVGNQKALPDIESASLESIAPEEADDLSPELKSQEVVEVVIEQDMPIDVAGNKIEKPVDDDDSKVQNELF